MKTDQPKPATGEWTAEYVKSLWPEDGTNYGLYKSVSAAHNAALRNAQPFLDDALKQLADERSRVEWLKSQLKLSNDALSPCQQEIQQLRKQLAEHIKELERQLAAAHAAIAKHHTLGWNCPRIEAGTTALAAAIAAAQNPLVDALTPLMRGDGHYVECPAPTQETHDTMPNSKAVQDCKRLQSALERVKEGK